MSPVFHFSDHIGRHTHPVSDVEETLLICEIKQEDETHRISKESCCQTSEPEIIPDEIFC